jgi:hypothetical protein
MHVHPGGIMREEIRLGNEAMERNDFETARQHFQQLLSEGGTALQVRIAENRLREIQDQMDALHDPPAAKTRARRKTTGGKKAATDEPPHKVVRPPEKPIVVIRKH